MRRGRPWPRNQTSTVGQAAGLQIHAIARLSLALSYKATGLPAGLSINPSTGLISGTPSGTGTSTAKITVTDKPGAWASVSFTWTVN